MQLRFIVTVAMRGCRISSVQLLTWFVCVCVCDPHPRPLHTFYNLSAVSAGTVVSSQLEKLIHRLYSLIIDSLIIDYYSDHLIINQSIS